MSKFLHTTGKLLLQTGSMSAMTSSRSSKSSCDKELVLVTGATGYLASCLVKQLAETGDYRLRCTVRSLENNQKLEALKQVLVDCKTQPEFVKADLLQSADLWKNVVKGCDYVLHIASPFPMGERGDPDLIIRPAVEGTLSVLRACADSDIRTVKRVVITSSFIAVADAAEDEGKVFTEEDWPDVSNVPSAYGRSKTLAERAAWDFVERLPEEKRFELAILNPGLIVGPPVIKIGSTSIDIVKNMLNGAWPLVPKIGSPVIDIRDAVLAHVNAIKAKGAAGHRHILSNGTYWMNEISGTLADKFNPQGFWAPRYQAPNFIISLYSLFDAALRQFRNEVGSFLVTDNTRMRTVLEIEPRPIKQSLEEMGDALIELGIVPKPKSMI